VLSAGGFLVIGAARVFSVRATTKNHLAANERESTRIWKIRRKEIIEGRFTGEQKVMERY